MQYMSVSHGYGIMVEYNGGCEEDKKGEDSLTSTRRINGRPLIDINASE